MPAKSRRELEDLLADIADWDRYGNLRGILGRRLELAREYLNAFPEEGQKPRREE